MVRDNYDSTVLRIPAYFYTATRLVTQAQKFDINSVLTELNNKVEQFSKQGFGFELERIVRFVLAINKYRPIHCSTHIPTSDWLAQKHCIINVKNKDNRCFLWSVIAALYPASENPSRLSHYVEYKSKVNVDGLVYPVSTEEIPRFEDNNPEISVNVLAIDEDARSFCVEYVSPHRSRTHYVNLLLLEVSSNPSKRHYTYIKNMSALVAHRTKHDGKTYVCNSCLHPFSKQETLDRHIPYCIKHDAQQVIYPNAENEKKTALGIQISPKTAPRPFLHCS